LRKPFPIERGADNRSLKGIVKAMDEHQQVSSRLLQIGNYVIAEVSVLDIRYTVINPVLSAVSSVSSVLSTRATA
jgi:hypothetical protein